MTEPKTGREIGVWFNDSEVWGYKGSCSVVIQFNKKTSEHATEPYVVSRCPPCERARLPAQSVKRWLILPP